MSGVAMVACPSRLTLIMMQLLSLTLLCSQALSDVIRREGGDPYAAAKQNGKARDGASVWWLWVPAFAGTTGANVVPSLRLVRPDRDLELADLIALAAQYVAGLDRAHALRRAGVVHIARIERVERRRELDQPADVVDQVLGVGGLLEHAIDGERHRDVVRIGDLVGSHEPG